MSLSGPAVAMPGFNPNRYPSQQTLGQGIYFAPENTVLYKEPSFQAPIIKQYQWDPTGATTSVMDVLDQVPIRARSCFVTFYPQLKLAMLAVVGENGKGWVEVVYQQHEDYGQIQTAWAPLKKTVEKAQSAKATKDWASHWGQYQTWLEFMKLNARPNGVIWLNGVPTYHQSVRSKPQDGAKFIPMTIMKRMRPLHVRGNWLLVEVIDINRQRPMGWLRWRDDDGQLLLFPNFSGQQQYTIPVFR